MMNAYAQKIIPCIFASLIFCCPCYAVDSAITSFTIDSGLISLGWEDPTNRVIIELFSIINQSSLCYASSSGSTISNLCVICPSNDHSIIRLQYGLQVVVFKDYDFENNVRANIINKHYPDNAIYDSDICDIQFLKVHYSCITNIAGIEYMTGLESLHIYCTCIFDITPLSCLTNLYSLDLQDNQIENISTLSNLTQLVLLSLNGNKISDLNALAGLTNLWSVSLYDNSITNIEPLISNAQNGGLGTGDYVVLWGNVIDDTNQVLVLRSYGVTVQYP